MKTRGLQRHPSVYGHIGVLLAPAPILAHSADLVLNIHIRTVTRASKGKNKSIWVMHRKPSMIGRNAGCNYDNCRKCGGEETITCPSCRGNQTKRVRRICDQCIFGEVRDEYRESRWHVNCGNCDGRGNEYVEEACNRCDGDGEIECPRCQ